MEALPTLAAFALLVVGFIVAVTLEDWAMAGKYPFPDDCEECNGNTPCAEHEHLAERDNQGDRAHKGA